MKKWTPRTFKLLIGVFGALFAVSWGTANLARGNAPPWMIAGLISLGFVFVAAVIALLGAEYVAGAEETTQRRRRRRPRNVVLGAVVCGVVLIIGILASTPFGEDRNISDEYGTTSVRTCQTPVDAGSNVLRARFQRSGTNTITVPFGQDAVIKGKLTNDAGKPLADATLCVEEWVIGTGNSAFARTAVPRIGFAHTDTKGVYAYRIPAGPNRETIFNYRDRTSQTTFGVRYFANAMPTLHSAPERVRNDGPPIRFWGKLPGPRSHGRVIILQAQMGPANWVTFRQATTDRDGRFRASYRFRRTFQPTTYRFRALVPRQVGYPWLPGTSRPVSARVN